MVAGIVGSFSTGCALGTVRPLQSVGVEIADRGTCEGKYVQSIWKGEDISGPECATYVAVEGPGPDFDRRRVQKVCEQTQIRTILSGEASTSFTLQACAAHEPRYQQARLGKACQEVSRARIRIQEDLTPAQSAACKTYLEPGGFSNVDQRIASRGAVLPAERLPAPREAALAKVHDGAAEAVAAGGVASGSVASDLSACEDRYIDSIWNGVDTTGGAECAGYVSADGSAPQYRVSRIQNVCEGAEVRSVRKGEALPAFTAHACQVIFAARQVSPDVPAVPPQAPAAATASAPAEVVLLPGLDEATIARTVDEHWRSIGRDCVSVAPRSSPEAGSPEEPVNTPVTVTIRVAASGQVRAVSARARGHEGLESCIERSVRSWSFPAAAADTEVGLPLVFVGE
ncbi:MAG: hypothetical protein RL033_6826 [Pseudomonadota bacterium]